MAPLHQAQKVISITTLAQRLRKLRDLVGADPTLQEGDFLGAGHLQPLAGLDGLDEICRLLQGLVGAGVEPSSGSGP
jgi:hypothetical protein